MIVLDTTVLVYAVGSDHPFRDPSRLLIGAIRDGLVRATTTIEVIQEFVHVRGKRGDRAEAAALGRDWAETLTPLVSVESSDLDLGLGLYEREPILGAFDCLLAAAALRRGADGLVSADTGFRSIPGLNVIGLTVEEIDELLGRGGAK